MEFFSERSTKIGVLVAGLILLGFLVSQSTATCVPCNVKDYNEQEASQVLHINTKLRNNTLKCIFRLIDLNRDWRVTEKEFDKFRETLGWKEKFAARWSLLSGRCGCDCDSSSVTIEEALVMYKPDPSWMVPIACLDTNKAITEAWERFCQKESMPGDDHSSVIDLEEKSLA